MSKGKPWQGPRVSNRLTEEKPNYRVPGCTSPSVVYHAASAEQNTCPFLTRPHGSRRLAPHCERPCYPFQIVPMCKCCRHRATETQPQISAPCLQRTSLAQPCCRHIPNRSGTPVCCLSREKCNVPVKANTGAGAGLCSYPLSNQGSVGLAGCGRPTLHASSFSVTGCKRNTSNWPSKVSKQTAPLSAQPTLRRDSHSQGHTRPRSRLESSI